jgi:wyosine [tRNA(Phe)-imidazoG37] synthetase (radical SAM superfamily)
MISFGPIPSRRLGKSLGINNISSAKKCSYSCIYCQVGITRKLSITRGNYFEPDVIFTEVQKHLNSLQEADKPDYLTFVANGEPTLDANLGKSIEKLKTFQIPIAVITNASLLNQKQVRDDLRLADWVSVKVDANNEDIWKAINRPFGSLDFKAHVEGLLNFSTEYKGKLVTETMLVQGINDSTATLKKTAGLIAQLKPAVAYIAIPTRPPALSWVKAPDETAINKAYQIFTEEGLNTELILGFEGTNTGFTGNAMEDIINISTVHPIREDTMLELLRKNNADPTILTTLVQGKYIQQIKYGLNTFYIRKFHS